MAHTAFNRAAKDFRTEVHLLIIQRNELLARSFARYLRPYYAHVHVTSTARDAEDLLRTVQAPVHVVCGLRLAPIEADGARCIERWRREFPAIVRAVLATGADDVPSEVPGVDAVFHTPSEPRALEDLLRGSPRSSLSDESKISQFGQQQILTEDSMKTTKNQTKAHDLKTLKEKSTIAPRPTAGTLSTAQGFSVA
jgi:DNA-binding NarL/FixJ family response regulator